MNDLEAQVSKLITDKEKLTRLLAIEKERRSAPRNSLVFLGMANVAQHWWCTQQAVFKSRADEINFFAAYLSDRIGYAHRLGFVDKLPRSLEALLDIGNEITFVEVQKLLKEKEKEEKKRTKQQASVYVIWQYEDTTDKQGKRTRLINPDLPPEEKELYKKSAAKEGIRVIDLEEKPMRRGEILEASQAEKYPTIRWHFPWNKYIVVGVPDGITKKFVYEYKTTRSQFLLRFMKPVADAQSDLYGYFFRRPQKRVQIYVVEENVTRTYEEGVDVAKAEATLSAFSQVDLGEPAHPPRESAIFGQRVRSVWRSKREALPNVALHRIAARLRFGTKPNGLVWAARGARGR